MELTLENFRGIANGTISIAAGRDAHITQLAGPNGSGKTAVIQVLQSLVTGEKIPVAGVKVKDAACMVREGKKTAKGFITWGEVPTTITWPSCRQSGPEIKCSKYAAGLLDPALMTPDQLAASLQILPTKDELHAQLKDHPDLVDAVDKVWQSITENGWDKAFKAAEAKRAELKRDWGKLAGKEWTALGAPTWLPENYSELPAEDLQVSLESAQKIYEHAIKSVALSDKAREDLAALAAKGPAPGGDGSARAELDRLTAEYSGIDAEISKQQTLLKEVPKILNKQKAYKCWSCGTLGCLDGENMVQPPDATSEDEANASRAKMAEIEATIRTLTDKRSDLGLALRAARGFVSQCEDAQRSLNSITLDEPCAISVDDARAELERCRQRIAAGPIKTECDEIDQLIRVNDYLCSVLSPEGLRKQVLAAKLAEFNELLDAICEVGGWPVVFIDELLDIRWGPTARPYAMLSVGQQFAVRVALQVAIRRMDGSPMLIIDGVDILDRKLLAGFMEIIGMVPVPVVIGHKYTEPDEVPDLGDNGISYWCNGEVVARLVTKEKVTA